MDLFPQCCLKTILYFGIICYFYRINTSSLVLRANKKCSTSSDPLILTPLIQQNKIEEARTDAKVIFKEFNNTLSYSGYFTVDERYNSNSFFWFFPSQENYETAPVVLWLQGGPGASSLYGLFTENGPFEVLPEGNVVSRNVSWTKNHSVLYIDNPVGTGFSFTDEGGYAQNETIIGKQLYTALLQFFQLFPELQKNDFYITGESYAGKYVPVLAYTIYKSQPHNGHLINLQGIAIGNGWSDPEHQTGYAEYLYKIGLIDLNTRRQVAKTEKNIISLIRHKKWEEATSLSDSMMNNITKVTGFTNYFNYLVSTDAGSEPYAKFLQRADVSLAVHGGCIHFNGISNKVSDMLQKDEMQSVAPLVSKLLSHYRVLLYTGQLDIIVAYPLTLNYLQHLHFTGAKEYKTASRHQWKLNGDIAGYVKQAGNLTEILVRNAGHMVPADQPLLALDMISKFTRNQPFY